MDEFDQRDIFYLKVGRNVGHEENGKGQSFLRPVIVLRKFGPHVFWGIPLSFTEKRGPYYHCPKGRMDVALLTQLRLFDARRMLHKIGVIPLEDFGELKKKVIGLF